ncbi:SDR family oxidoreductase [Mucilaginibacter sp. UYCu711]|uniref:SDR family oxidoreductase n=1 Tax=Mucilaginibacter sp. UYCu711 TaxID=3156339 RepID=UPI003D1D9D42
MYENKYHTEDLNQYKFLITGGAGFIGSNLVEYLLKNGALKVRVLDNFSTGFDHNIDGFKSNPSFELIKGDIRDFETCKRAVDGMDYVSHQAALGSVPRSINDPITTNEVNITGFLNMLCAVKDNGNVKRVVYAASSSTYGDSEDLPKIEERIGKPLSPYAVTKYVNELYAEVFAKTYGIETIGLRYFNVFGPKQSINGAYTAVIPKFIKNLFDKTISTINGDGEQSRDFTYIENVIQANVLALFTPNKNSVNEIYNIACGSQISLNTLFSELMDITKSDKKPQYGPDRIGDVRNSLADINKAKIRLGYDPQYSVIEGLNKTYQWYLENSNSQLRRDS